MPTTRSNLKGDQSSSDPEEVCYITRDALESLIREVADSRSQQMETNQNIAQSLEKIANTMAEMSTNVVNTSTTLSEKLESLIEAVKQNNTTTSTTTVDEHLKQRKSLTERIVRNELVTSYYNELLGEEKPFVRKEFRTKVHQNASDTDIRNRRQQTIDNVKWEIKIMQDRLIEFNEKKSIRDTKIEEFLKRNEDSRENIMQRMQKMETKIREEYERDKLSLMKRTDAEEKRFLTEYILTFHGEETNACNKPKNLKGQQKNRRPPRRGNKGF